jgi:hypothetical protein
MMLNTRTRTIVSIWAIVMQIFLLSCSATPSKDTQPNVDIDDSYLNQQVLVNAPDYFNSFQTNDPLVLEVISSSESEIRFSNDFSLRIFQKIDDGWVEIKELPMTRLPKDDVILSPNTSASQDLAVFPDLKNHSQSYQLRIYVFGDMQTEQGSQKVSAYTEVQLQP